MHIDIDSMTEKEVRERANKLLRIYFVAEQALSAITYWDDAARMKKIAFDALALIERYPYDDVFLCGGTQTRKEMEAAAEKAAAAETP